MQQDDKKNMETQPELILYVTEDGDAEAARALADKMCIPLVTGPKEFSETQLMLQMDAEGLSLRQGKLVMQGDFTGMKKRLKKANLQGEMLVKAARIKGESSPRVIDATAGMGEDSLLLAAAGYQVELYERDPVIAALLQDALRRAANDPDLADAVGRMHFVEGDSLDAMKRAAEAFERPDVIYLDPMFPERSKSGLIKKKFQLLQQLEKPADDEEALLLAAMAVHPRKIVIKRPLKGPYLAGRTPSHSHAGKAIRYDCFVFA